MFSVGDKIVYGGTGVCTVEGIGVPDIPGASRECYILRPQYMQSSKIYAPIEDNPVKMRPLLQADEAEALIDHMPRIRPFAIGQDREEQARIYSRALKSADCATLARLVKTLYQKQQSCTAQRKTLPSREKELLNRGQELLHGELATALHLPLQNVEGYILTRIGSSRTS